MVWLYWKEGNGEANERVNWNCDGNEERSGERRRQLVVPGGDLFIDALNWDLVFVET
jgi:hypothetical protein